MLNGGTYNDMLDPNFDGVINAADITRIYDVLLNGD